MKKIIVLVFLLLPSLVFAGETLDVNNLMTHREFVDAGLNKLTSEEMDTLNRWLIKFAREREKEESSSTKEDRESRTESEGLIGSIVTSSNKDVYTIQSIGKGGDFEINNHHFETMKKCPGFKEGDEVVFTEGSSYGMCTTARFEKPGGSESCKVWCKED